MTAPPRRVPRIFLTGAPGSGKSTLALAVVETLRQRGIRLAGLVTPERRQGRRTGFRIVDLASGTERLMAGVDVASRHTVGRYGVDVAAINAIVGLFLQSLPEAQVVVIDEIGKMELLSPRFEAAVQEALASGKPVLAVVHRALAKRYEAVGELVQMSRGQVGALKERLVPALWRVRE